YFIKIDVWIETNSTFRRPENRGVDYTVTFKYFDGSVVHRHRKRDNDLPRWILQYVIDFFLKPQNLGCFVKARHHSFKWILLVFEWSRFNVCHTAKKFQVLSYSLSNLR